MIAPQVDIFVNKSNTDVFLEALKPCWEAVTKEPRCMFFDIFHTSDPTDENIEIFRIIEVWDADEEWFVNVQGKKEYYKPYFELMNKLSVKPKKFSIWQRMDQWFSVR